ncbi:hypothetical protein BT96DRAFT_823811 [Gymnopus androsaceus JB14]|uniref:Zinc finger PHD-type domain-containing protein n=1 Tax=Gymnopus androsaceus JB14 TaxID=1447944 RepID=A0A6A4HJM2_9AGAR|nr:hypothetical protein BT96DRAFT_823811 [Gymnopus androsaceus JB14]
MSTRTTRSKANSAQNLAAAASPAPPSKTVTKASKVNSKSQDLDVQAGKENNSVKVPAAGKSTAQVKGKARATSSTTSDQPFCTCKKGDDGTPMIHCTECKDWLHFSCVDLEEIDAEDIRLYVCPSCSQKTGLHSLSEYIYSFSPCIPFFAFSFLYPLCMYKSKYWLFYVVYRFISYREPTNLEYCTKSSISPADVVVATR